MNHTVLWVTVAVVLMIALLFCRSRGTNLNVDPHVCEEIEKAKRRQSGRMLSRNLKFGVAVLQSK